MGRGRLNLVLPPATLKHKSTNEKREEHEQLSSSVETKVYSLSIP